MFYIVPITITDAMLVSSSVAETDYTAWSAGTAYSVGNRVMRAVAGVHANFERLVAGTTATAPENDPINWVRVGPTNRWAMLDGAVGTSTSGTASISVTLTPGVVRGLALLDLDVEGVTVTMVVDGDTVYTRVIDPVGSQEDVDSWYAYFFEAIQRRRTVVLTDANVITEFIEDGGALRAVTHPAVAITDGFISAVGHDERDGVADELDLTVGQWRAGGVRNVLARNRVPRLPDVRVEIGGGEDRTDAR